MKPLKQFLNLFRRRTLETEMAEEMRLHLEMQAERNRAAGMSEVEAGYAAQREFGNVASLQEQARAGRGWVWVEQVVQDVRYSFLSVRKAPGFTSVVVLTLALGLGVNTALFTWFNAIAFRPLPVMNPDQLYTLARVDVNGGTRHSMPYPDFMHFREHQSVFSELTAAAGCGVEFGEGDAANPVTGEEPVMRRVDAVATSYFALFGVPMALGRPLVPDDETSTRAQAVMVLSHEFWQRQFNGDPAIVGRAIRVQGLAEETVTVVGVTGPEFHGTHLGTVAGWVPMLLRPGQAWRTDGIERDCLVTGRLRSGVSPEQATEELQAIAGTLPTRGRAGSSQAETIALVGASSYIVLTAKQAAQLLPLIALFGVVLVVAGVNASNLILARAVTRQFEFAVRSALGATRRRLFAQIMTEALVLGLLGGVAGWLIAAGLLRFVWPWLLNMVPGAREALAGLNLQADHRVLGFTVAVSLLAGAVGGLLPALQATRRNLDSGLKRDGSIFGPRLHLGRVRNLLAIAQLALSAALLFTAGSLVHRARGGEFADVGLDQARLATFQVRIPWKLPPDRIDAARRQAIERIRALPAVAAVSEMPRFPFAAAGTQAVIPGGGGEPASTRAILHLSVPADYFSTVQLPVIQGRIFTESEIAGDPVVVINEKAAREFWPADNPVGQRLELPTEIVHTESSPAGQTATSGDRPRIAVTVVGVVGNTRAYYPWSDPRPMVFLPPAPQSKAAPYLVVRTHEDAKRSFALLQQIGREATGRVPQVASVSEVFERALIQYRTSAWVAGILAGISLLVAVIGLHGVMSFAVNQRVREIGIRMALGATPGRVVSSIVYETLVLVAAGSAVGYGLSVLISKVARSLLQGVEPFNPWAGVAVLMLLGAIGLLACWVPARRAARVDPMVALRAE